MINVKSFDYYASKKYFIGKGIIVTGATGGIGSLLTKTLCDLGARVVAVVKDDKKFISQFSSYINNSQLKFEKIDFCDNVNVQEEFSNIMFKLGGKLDIMFLCHGRFDVNELIETTNKDFDTAVNTNTRSLMTMISLATPFLKLTCGNIVAISSLESFIPVKSSFLNTVTKSMVNMLIQSSALELAPFGIRVNGVAPGITNTPIREKVHESFKQNENRIYMKKMGTFNLLHQEVIEPQDIVEALLFLASDDAGFITGEIIKVDNGYSLNHDLCFSTP